MRFYFKVTYLTLIVQLIDLSCRKTFTVYLCKRFLRNYMLYSLFKALIFKLIDNRKDEIKL